MPQQPNTGGRPPKHDYDADEFYLTIHSAAIAGATDAEIAHSLDLSPEAFSQMKGGTYDGWSEEENLRRSERLFKVLTHARASIVSSLRSRYLMVALGGQEVETTATVSRRLRIDGQLTDDEEIQTTRTRSKTQPSLQAISTLLYHWDKEWRLIQQGKDQESQDIPTDVQQGIDISKWIDQEVQAKEQPSQQ